LSGKVFRIGTVRYNWPVSAHASQAFSIARTVPIRKICLVGFFFAFFPFPCGLKDRKSPPGILPLMR